MSPLRPRPIIPNDSFHFWLHTTTHVNQPTPSDPGSLAPYPCRACTVSADLLGRELDRGNRSLARIVPGRPSWRTSGKRPPLRSTAWSLKARGRSSPGRAARADVGGVGDGLMASKERCSVKGGGKLKCKKASPPREVEQPYSPSHTHHYGPWGPIRSLNLSWQCR